MKNTKIANINIRLKDLFKQWLEITRIFHNLPNQELKVLALLLYHHYKLKQDITNDKILWKMVFDYEIKMEIKEELDIKDQSIQNAISSLRKKNIIVDNKIISTYIPQIEEGADNFKIVFNFNIVNE